MVNRTALGNRYLLPVLTDFEEPFSPLLDRGAVEVAALLSKAFPLDWQISWASWRVLRHRQ